jgi:hypothetical protein
LRPDQAPHPRRQDVVASLRPRCPHGPYHVKRPATPRQRAQREQPLLPHGLQHLRHIERLASRRPGQPPPEGVHLLPDLSAQLPLRHVSSQRGDELHDIVGRQALQLQARGRRLPLQTAQPLPQRPLQAHVLRPHRQQHQRPRPALCPAPHCVAQQVPRPHVRPLHVVEEEDQRAARGQGLPQPRHRLEQPPLPQRRVLGGGRQVGIALT